MTTTAGIFKHARAVLFDLDGTLVESSEDIANSLNHVMATAGAKPLTVTEVRALIGDGASVLVQRAFAARGQPQPAEALTTFRKHYDEHCLDTTRLYLGMARLLQRLAEAKQPRKMAVITNKPTAFAEKILKALGVLGRFQEVMGPERVPARKPDRGHVLKTVNILGVPPQESVVVGDGPTDIMAGREAGASTIAVLWGYRTRKELTPCQPGRFVETPDELDQLLLG